MGLIEVEHPMPASPAQGVFRTRAVPGEIRHSRTQKPRRPVLLRIDGAGTEKRPWINEADTSVGGWCFTRKLLNRHRIDYSLSGDCQESGAIFSPFLNVPGPSRPAIPEPVILAHCQVRLSVLYPARNGFHPQKRDTSPSHKDRRGLRWISDRQGSIGRSGRSCRRQRRGCDYVTRLSNNKPWRTERIL